MIKMRKLDRLVLEYYKLEEQILQEIGGLKNYGNDCDCGIGEREPFTFTYIYEGGWKEIQTVCLKCGGTVNEL
jgi:hypothetical protein